MKPETFFEKFDELADTPNGVKKLRELVLWLATTGHLIPTDGSGWANVALKEIASARMGKTILKSELSDAGISVYSAGRENTAWGFIAASDLTFHTGTIVVSARGTIGFPKIPTESEFISTQTTIAITPISKEIDSGYLRLQLQTVDWDDLTAKTAIPMITVKQVHAIEVRYPYSLAEQKRIVAKVNELMALCGQLEAQQQERETRHAALVRASLARFADAPTPANLPFLFHQSYAITPADLRKCILTLAVQGKLVPQDPNDEPADVLLARIWRKKSGAKGDDTGIEELSSLNGGFSPPFEIPSTWAWVRATEPTHSISDLGKKIKTKDVVEKGRFPVVDQGKQFIRGYCNDEEKVIHLDTPVVVFGDHTRETKLIDFDFIVGADGVKILKPIEINPGYYILALRWLPLDDRGYGRHFRLLRAASIPIPPLAEQRRIVAKVEQLMSLVDVLESKLATRRNTGEGLMEAVVAELTAGA